VFTTQLYHPAPPDGCDDPNMQPELNISDAMGSDEIPSIVLQRCAVALYQPLGHLLNLTY